MESLELKQSYDREKLRSYAYKRILLAEYVMNVDTTNENLENATNYGATFDCTADCTEYTFLQLNIALIACARKFFKNIRDADLTDTYKWTILSTELLALYWFGCGFMKGYQLIPLYEAGPTEYYVDEATTTAIPGQATDAIDCDHGAVENYEAEDQLICNGYYMGAAYRQRYGLLKGMDAANSTANFSARKMLRFMVAAAAWEYGLIQILGIDQSFKAKLAIGKLMGLIPTEFNDLETTVASELWRYIFTGKFPTTNMETNVGESIDNLASYINYDYSYLPGSTLDILIKKRNRAYQVPVAASNTVKRIYGLGHAEIDFPTEFAHLVTLSDECEWDKKYVGYDFKWFLWFMDQFYKGTDPIDQLFLNALNEEHWQYKGFRELWSGFLVTHTLQSFKGFADSNIFKPLRWHLRCIDHTKELGALANVVDRSSTYDQLNPAQMIPTTSPDPNIVLYCRGNWSWNEISDLMLLDLLHWVPAKAGANVEYRILALGEQHFVRSGKTINFVGAETGQFNYKIGIDFVYNDNIYEALGVELIDYTGSATGAAIPTRLPTEKFPFPTFQEDIYNQAIVQKLIILPFGMGSTSAPAAAVAKAAKVVEENKNANTAVAEAAKV